MKALLFDLDGTLTDISRREIETLFDTVNHFGLNVSRAEVEKIYFQMPSYVEVLEKFGLRLSDEVFHYLTSSFVKNYPLAVAREGVKSMLKTLSEKYVLVCVTSRETLTEVTWELNFLGINHLFDFVVARDVAAKHFGLDFIPFSPFYEQRKMLYQCALELANCSPREAIVIGDMERELKPAKELGITTIGIVAHEARKNELEEASDFLISNIAELQGVLSKI
ncbi:MAG: HAD family phosphatase [Candidatus Bathyarchaeia archaeon]